MPSKTIITDMYENIFHQTSPSFRQIFLKKTNSTSHSNLSPVTFVTHTLVLLFFFFLPSFCISFLTALNFSVVHECILPSPYIVPQNILHSSGHPTFLMGVLLVQTCHLGLWAMDFALLIRNVSHTVEPW